MTQLMKKFGLILILAFTTFFSSCEKDLYEEDSHSKGYSVNELSFIEANSIQKFKTSFSKLNEEVSLLKTANRGADSSSIDYNFRIDSTKIKEIVYDDKVTYTMAITRDELTPKYFENLVLEINNLNEKQAYIVKYTPSEEIKYNELHHEFEFVGNISSLKLFGTWTIFNPPSDNNPGGDNPDMGGSVNCVAVLKCNYGGSEHYAGANCTPSYTYIVVECTENGTYGNGSFTGSGSSSYNNGASGYNGGGPDDTQYSNTTTTTNPVVTTPVITITSPPITDSDINDANIVANQFYYLLSKEKKMLCHTKANLYQTILDYLTSNITDGVVNNNALLFADEIINQMMLNPALNINIETSANSPAFIDTSSVMGNTPEEIKFRQVYNSLQQSSNFKNLFTNLFGVTNFINVKFKIENINQPGVGGTCQLFSSSFGGLTNEIIINRNNLLTNSNVNIATAIIHECIHAFLNIKLRHPNIGMTINNINNLNLQQCINTYYNGFSGDQSQHDFFVDFLIPTISSILNEVKEELFTSQQISTAEHPLYSNQYIYGVNPTIPATYNEQVLPWSWDHFFYYQSQVGLQNCTAFNVINPLNSSNYLNFIQYIQTGTLIFAP